MKWLNCWSIKLTVIVFVIALGAGDAMGRQENSNAERPGITPASPRLSTIVVEVTITNDSDLDELARAGYDISNVQGNVVTIYASLEELEQLKGTGYSLREIEPRIQSFKLMALGGYHNYSTLTDELNTYAESYPEICRLYSLGRSVEGRELWAMLISDNPDDEEDEPEFKYVSTIHGNERICTEMCLYFIDLLLTEYGTDERIANLVDSTAIWIVPLMNPDGLERNTRANANGFDLNRNFPLLTDGSLNIFTGEPLDALNRQPEVRHIMSWTAENSFVLSAGFHTSAMLVCYPYGYNEQMSAVDTPTPDDLLFEEISRRYTIHNPRMWNSSQFPDGIVNAAKWYPVIGEMADWNYRYVSCNEVTIELYNSQIPTLWNENSESMLSVLETIHIGVRGIITERSSGEPLWAEVLVKGNSHPVFTDPDIGDYHRMLLPGTYDLIFNVPGYVPRSVKNVTVNDGHAVRIDIQLIPEQASPDFNGDGRIDIKDLLILIEHWGQEESSVDIAPLPDGDGIVDSEDLVLLMEYWQEEIPELDLVARWKLDESEGIFAQDDIGYNDANVVGDPIWQPNKGQVAGALEFDGIDDYITTDFVLNPADGPFSAFAWIKGGAPGQVVVSQQAMANWLTIDADGNLMTELKCAGRSAGPLFSETIITDGQWHRIGLVWDGSHRILYVDDIAVAEDTQVNPHSSDSGLYIGCGKTMEPGTYWSGLIDDVRIYNRVVSP
jgi:hypothetical protein